MLRYDRFVYAALRNHLPSSAMAAALLLASTGAGVAQPPEGPVSLLFTIPVPVASTNKTGGMYGFDISFVDQSTQTYYLGDRSNASVDVVDASSGTFVKHILAKPAFAGATGNNSTSGPNGVVAGGNCLFAGDGPSRVVSFMVPSGKQVSDVKTGGSFRADEMAFDPKDGLLLVANNAETIPFATFISVTAGCKMTLGTKIIYTFATNGAEQAVWDPGTGLFYQSIPQIGDAANPGLGPNGLVISLSPKTFKIVEEFPVYLCQPAGLSLDPTTQNLLAGCSVVFDTAGKAWSGTDTHTATPYQVVINAKTGLIQAYVPGVGGSDEVWYNSADNHWYTGSSKSQLAPTEAVSTTPSTPLTAQGAAILGVVDATSLTADQLVPTINVPAVTGVHVSGSSHSVAANAANNWVFVPHPANNALPGCLKGCIGVYGRADNDSD